MIWNLEDLQKKNVPQVFINGKWVPMRPENGKREYSTMKARFIAALNVFFCRAEAFRWPEGQ